MAWSRNPPLYMVLELGLLFSRAAVQSIICQNKWGLLVNGPWLSKNVDNPALESQQILSSYLIFISF